MAKLSVLDVMRTAKTLQRYENYANRNMEKVAVSNVNDAIKEAQKMMRDTNQAFLTADVSELTPDTSDLECRLECLQSYKKQAKQGIEQYKKELENPEETAKNNEYWDAEDTQQELEWNVSDLREAKYEIAQIKAKLE